MGDKPLWKKHQPRLDRLHRLPVNFDPSRRHECTEANGWYIDEYEAELPSEPPGPPVAGGAWESAQRFIREYKFPDPSIVTGIYSSDSPLEEGVMLLRARFLFFTFFFGVRVGEVIDEVREREEEAIRVWGFNYQTLKGHFEKGQMSFEVHKGLQSGQVRFRIHAFSRPARISNPFYRIGFLLFGRWLQRRFAERSLERLQRLVQAEVATAAGERAEAPADRPEVRPASSDRQAEQAMEQVRNQAKEDEGGHEST